MNEITKNTKTVASGNNPIKQVLQQIDLSSFGLTKPQQQVLAINLTRNCGPGSYVYKEGCKAQDIVMIGLQASQLNINIDGVEGCIIPFANKKGGTKKPALVIMTTGMLKIIHSNPDVLHFSTHMVYQDEYFKHNPFSIENPIEHDADTLNKKNPKDLIYAYCYYVVNRGGHKVHGAYVMNKHQIAEHKKCSKNETMWNDRTVDMWTKTVIRKTMKFAPLGIQNAIPDDNSGYEDNQNYAEQDSAYESVPTEDFNPTPAPAPAPVNNIPPNQTKPQEFVVEKQNNSNQGNSNQDLNDGFQEFGDDV